MQVVDWSKHKHKWKHLKGIKFPQVGPRTIVDLLIGMDHAELLCSMEDKRGEPILRLTTGVDMYWKPGDTSRERLDQVHILSD